MHTYIQVHNCSHICVYMYERANDHIYSMPYVLITPYVDMCICVYVCVCVFVLLVFVCMFVCSLESSTVETGINSSSTQPKICDPWVSPITHVHHSCAPARSHIHQGSRWLATSLLSISSGCPYMPLSHQRVGYPWWHRRERERERAGERGERERERGENMRYSEIRLIIRYSVLYLVGEGRAAVGFSRRRKKLGGLFYGWLVLYWEIFDQDHQVRSWWIYFISPKILRWNQHTEMSRKKLSSLYCSRFILHFRASSYMTVDD